MEFFELLIESMTYVPSFSITKTSIMWQMLIAMEVTVPAFRMEFRRIIILNMFKHMVRLPIFVMGEINIPTEKEREKEKNSETNK